MLASSPTPIVPSAVISVFRAASSHTEMLDVPIEQLDADGFLSAMQLHSRVPPDARDRVDPTTTRDGPLGPRGLR